MHIPGLLGMPRRIYTYEPGRGWDTWNLIVTIGVFFQAAGILVFLANLLWSYFRGKDGRQRSVGCLDSGVVHYFAAARIQLRPHPDGQEPPPALGSEASGRSGLEIRIKGAINDVTLNATSITLRAHELDWKLPARGHVGMYALIAAESAIFTIFVVAYLFYVGKSLPGPTERSSHRHRSFIPFAYFPAA